MTSAVRPLAEPLRLLAAGHSLTVQQSAAAFRVLVSGGLDLEDAAALLRAFKSKGESADEIAGAASALREAMIAFPAIRPNDLVDTCGTGGGRVGTLNLSTAAALLAVGAGVRVAKHGNRSHTSRSGSADLLEALGVDIQLLPVRALEVLATTGFTFLFAPLYHPSMRHVAPVRRQLGVPTIMNMLGPLANPARAGRQVIGVAERRMAPLLAEALRRLGTQRALVVHAEVGMDEISPTGRTEVWEVRDGTVTEWVIDPGAHGLEEGDLDSLKGGEPAENAERIARLLDDGRREPAARSALILNAAAAILVSGRAPDFGAAVACATEALETGKGADVLARLREAAPPVRARLP